MITTPAFVDAERYVWLLALTSLSSGFALIVMIGLQIEKKLAQVAWTTAAAAALNTLLNIMLIPTLACWARRSPRRSPT